MNVTLRKNAIPAAREEPKAMREFARLKTDDQKRAKPQISLNRRTESIYIHIPSVRSYILTALPKWFTHAIEAKAGPEVIEAIEAASRRRRLPKEVRRQLRSIGNRLEQRALVSGRKVARDIHFVIADNAPYYSDKAIGETHSPLLRQLAGVLNGIGNEYGIFIHHISTSEMELIRPAELQAAHPLFSLKQGNVKTGPGAATNIALTYVKTFHSLAYNKHCACLLRISDDVFPLLTPTNLGYGRKGFRNFFVDLMRYSLGKRWPQDPGYRGFRDNTGMRAKNGGRVAYIPFVMRRIELAKLKYYDTGFSEDVNHRQPGERFHVPPYLIHVGKTSTYKKRRRAIFGNYSRQGKVQPSTPEFVSEVLQQSKVGLDRPDHQS